MLMVYDDATCMITGEEQNQESEDDSYIDQPVILFKAKYLHMAIR